MKKLLLVMLLLSSYLFGAMNLQTASKADLMKISGIGAKKADAIIKYRKTHKIKSADDLLKIKGFGKGIVGNVKGNVKSKKTTMQQKRNKMQKKVSKKKMQEKMSHKKSSMKKSSMKKNKTRSLKKRALKKKKSLKNKFSKNKKKYSL
jgi:competence protein ComEA